MRNRKECATSYCHNPATGIAHTSFADMPWCGRCDFGDVEAAAMREWLAETENATLEAYDGMVDMLRPEWPKTFNGDRSVV